MAAPTAARFAVMVAPLLPANVAEPITSPIKAMGCAVANATAVDDVPDTTPMNVPAVTVPENEPDVPAKAPVSVPPARAR